MAVVTRFPPSPTGLMHIGTARTALYNWLFARHHGGKMLFRIEDTDRKRYDSAHVDAIVNGMKWLELDWDGEIVSQYERRTRHAEIARQLLAAGKAYHCYASPEELEAMREDAKSKGLSSFYDRRWRDTDKAPPAGIDPVIRIKAPLEGEYTLHDKVQGAITLANQQLDDFIILRSDGTPTYMLSVVVDDYDMGVTHVIRGDDHINNTFRQNLIYDAMDWPHPVYAHLPLILGPDGAKMSKRHGAASVEEYRDMGYLPEAMRNYLLRLGWSHGDDEIISTQQAIEWFNLDHVGKSGARFDFAKLESVNAHYIKQCDNARLIALAEPFYTIPVTETGRKRVLQGVEELKSRAKTLIQFAEESAFYHKTAPFEYDESAQPLIRENQDMLKTLYGALKDIAEEDYKAVKIQELCKEISKEKAGGKLGQIAMPLRAALTGTTQSPSIFDAAAILGRDETLARLNAAITQGT